MTTSQPNRARLAAASLWVAAFALAALDHRLPAWSAVAAEWGAIAALVGVGTAAWAVGTGRLRSAEGDGRRAVAQLLAGVALVLVAAGGGLRSPALPLLAVACAAVWWARPVARAAAHGVLFAAAALALHLLAHGVPSAGEAALLIAVVVGGGTLPVWLREREGRSVGRATEKVERLESFLTQRRVAPALLAGGGALTNGVLAREDHDRRERAAALAAFLNDVRDALGADEAVLWRWTAARDRLVPESWSVEGGGDPQVLSPARQQFLRWSADERVAQVEDAGSDSMAAAPVADAMITHGALTVRAAGRFALEREDVRAWATRYGAQAAVLVELFETKADFSRQNLKTQAILSAAQQFQGARTLEALGSAICETALDLAGARASLVKWDGNAGVVQATSGVGAPPLGLLVEESSLVGEKCRAGLPQVWEDGRTFGPAASVFCRGERTSRPASLGVVPLKRGVDVVGAIVIEGDAPRDIRIRDARHIRLLATIAVASLETQWHIEEISSRARTDALTGLANRRHFEDQFARVLGEAERFGGRASLVVCDVDFFKKVNDAHGHDAGDAVLKQVARTLQDGVRAVDVLARFGGEEFVVLLPHTDERGAAELAERLRLAVSARPARFGGKEIEVTASFGVATFPSLAATREQLFKAADQALYRAKREGRNRVCVSAALPHGTAAAGA